MSKKGVAMNTRIPKREYGLYLVVVSVLGLTVIASLVGAIALTLTGLPTPELLVAFGSAAIGGLAGLLAPSPANR